MKRILVEFYSHRTPENLLSLLKERFDGAVFFYFEDAEPKDGVKEQMKNVIRRLCGWEAQFYGIPERGIEAALKALETLEEGVHCTVDLTGGEEILAAAAGIFCQRRENVCLHQYCVKTGELVFSYPAKIGEDAFPYHLDAEALLSLGGTRPIRVPRYQFSRGPLKDEVLRLWNAVRRNLSDWNVFCSLPVSLLRKESVYCRAAGHKEGAKRSLRRILKCLEQGGIVRDVKEAEEKGSLLMEYRLEIAPEAFVLYEKAGNLLELYAALAFFEAGLFHDICVGVEADWNDIKERHATPDPKNEIDLFLVRFDLPVVGSCKNTFPKNDYLYEIRVMAAHYGGYYATPLLVSSFGATPTVKKRAEEMGVVLLDGVARIPFRKLVSIIKKKLQA